MATRRKANPSLELAPRPVTIRGKDFKSINAAARWAKVTPMAVWKAIRKGTLDNVGLTKRKRARAQKKET